jgi:hypothetical protein
MLKNRRDANKIVVLFMFKMIIQFTDERVLESNLILVSLITCRLLKRDCSKRER